MAAWLAFGSCAAPWGWDSCDRVTKRVAFEQCVEIDNLPQYRCRSPRNLIFGSDRFLIGDVGLGSASRRDGSEPFERVPMRLRSVGQQQQPIGISRQRDTTLRERNIFTRICGDP